MAHVHVPFEYALLVLNRVAASTTIRHSSLGVIARASARGASARPSLPSGRRFYSTYGSYAPGSSGDASARGGGLTRLRALNRRGDAEGAIELFESGAVEATPHATAEYVKALVRLDRLDESALAATLSRGAMAATGNTAYRQAATATSAGMAQAAAAPPPPPPPSWAAAPQYGPAAHTAAAAGGLGSAAAAGVGGPLGSPENPLVTVQAEPGFRTQLWRTVRMVAATFLFLSAGGALLEDRTGSGPISGGGGGGGGGPPGGGAGLARALMGSRDVTPAIEPETRFKDVKGCDEAKSELVEVVEFLKAPAKFTRLGGKLPKGVLLVGPPGTGKTLLAKAVAGEAGVPFFYCSGSEFEEMFVGVGARRVRDLFQAAKRRNTPCIIFIDEIDAIGGSRNPKDQQYMKMTLNQLLVELDGFNPSEGIIVIAATNFPESLDKALVRPGRFDRHVVVPNPDVKGRQQILELYGAQVVLDKDVDLNVLARGTPGFSGAELSNLVNIAAIYAATKDRKAVTLEDLEYAKDKILMGSERKTLSVSDKSRKLTAYHETGHALVALYTEGAMPLHKATIVPRGRSLGLTMQLPDDKHDSTSESKRQLLARLDVCMGGRVAEELIFGADEITTGASHDLQQATRIARNMVLRFGFSESRTTAGGATLATPAWGLSSSDGMENGYESLSSESKVVIEREVASLLSSSYERVRKLLKTHDKDLNRVAQALIDRETLSGTQIKELCT
ncbi:ATP-dependent zinc metalloprotease FTSH [Pycnococcus provasolii]|uniref:ATP-dependent zinc metalloprotease FTSH n=1 Tax=Pycnococcus provasolii TaxID=41880 RepID=A0A830HDS8_9CHLO|nr:ATP-dependent zinc metalloprotease FTSH [Pycnococcus provasolii]